MGEFGGLVGVVGVCVSSRVVVVDSLLGVVFQAGDSCSEIPPPPSDTEDTRLLLPKGPALKQVRPSGGWGEGT